MPMDSTQKRPDVAALRRRFEGNALQIKPEKEEDRASGPSRRPQSIREEPTQQQPRARWNHTFPLGPESRQQAQNLEQEENEDEVAAQINRLSSSECVQDTNNGEQCINSRKVPSSLSLPLLLDYVEGSPPQIDITKATGLNQDQTVTKQRRTISFEVPPEASAHSILDFGQPCNKNGKGKQTQEEVYHTVIKKEEGDDDDRETPSPAPLNWQERISRSPADGDFKTSAEGHAKVDTPPQRVPSAQVEPSDSEVGSPRIASLEVLKRYRPHAFDVASPPSSEPEEFHRAALPSRTFPGGRTVIQYSYSHA
ncbi:hypothetical protein N0V83_001250 [Neocucurbitaria cava]|uniref:Uncharacterized protein n=1 Tax=Neocucurbitaria cava TaxID=798079 RepID=A0A9W9CR70_9PLEO|nr:hypothetical protein N0V83_001250 [Neocucurbitaria cava]